MDVLFEFPFHIRLLLFFLESSFGFSQNQEEREHQELRTINFLSWSISIWQELLITSCGVCVSALRRCIAKIEVFVGAKENGCVVEIKVSPWKLRSELSSRERSLSL